VNLFFIFFKKKGKKREERREKKRELWRQMILLKPRGGQWIFENENGKQSVGEQGQEHESFQTQEAPSMSLSILSTPPCQT